MSSRRSEVQTESKNPAEKFLTWSSQNKCLVYYDKEEKENKLVKLPFTFLYLADRTTVKGYDANDNTGIYSNEVKYLSEPLTVKNFAGKTLAEGEWNEISTKVDRSGGKFAKSIYAMTKKGTLINICLYGGALGEWFEFTKKSKKRLPDEWVTVEGFEERKKGATTYYVPIFKYNKSLSDTEGSLADKAYDLFEEYETEPKPRKAEIAEENLEPVKSETYDDDLDFL